MAFREFCPTWHNHTDYFYAELQNLGKKSVSPILLASLVVGMVLTISCITIILGKMSWEMQPRPQPQHQFRRRRRHYRHRDSQEHSLCGRGMRCGSHSEAEVCRLHSLLIDAPPSYEECTGPGATQLYLPTEAPPPYALMDADSDLHTVSVDALPSYEAVCGPCPPQSLQPLPGPVPEPSSLQGPLSPKGSLASSPEMIV